MGPEPASNHQLAASTFVSIVATLVDEFNVIDVLTALAHNSVELLDVSAAGILIDDSAGHLRVVGASSDNAQILELFQIRNDEGPCVDCYRSGNVIESANLTTEHRWPQFTALAVAAGYCAVCAVALQYKGHVIGCLNLFSTNPGPLGTEAVALAKALADVACLSVVQDRASSNIVVSESQFMHALTNRSVIEVAKGIIAAHDGVAMDTALVRLWTYSRNNRSDLEQVAAALVDGTLAASDVGIGRREPHNISPDA